MTSVTIEKNAQVIAVPKYHILPVIEREPNAGPMSIERPKTAPFTPKIFDLSSGFVRSAIIACATEAFPHVIPSKTRERNITNIGRSKKPKIVVSGRREAIQRTIQLRSVPACVSIKIGFRPYLSESAQSIGAATN